ncbi:unnamed protein product [Diabrotica balteata]|uniref:Uncharacterized protein n=1 Tax=Diabrotica balteata TaxID=107213 RepID=A0A9N9T0S8_DIABA|nr:unnamed protein product [Diabrotica balteata]
MYARRMDVKIDENERERTIVECRENGRMIVERQEKISQNPLEPHDNKYHVEIIFTLKSNFKNRFKDFNEMALVVAQFVVSPFMEIDVQQFAPCVMQNFGEDIAATEMEVIEFQNNLALKSSVSSTECIWPIVSKDKYSVLCRVAL